MAHEIDYTDPELHAALEARCAGFHVGYSSTFGVDLYERSLESMQPGDEFWVVSRAAGKPAKSLRCVRNDADVGVGIGYTTCEAAAEARPPHVLAATKALDDVFLLLA